MAVFPDFISLKNSTDSEAAIIAAIETGGTDPINQGELVIGLSAGAATLFTKDSLGDIVTISGSGGGGGDGGGRGDGGDFNTGTVSASYVLGVYGGGDFDAGTDDVPSELLNEEVGPDGGVFA